MIGQSIKDGEVILPAGRSKFIYNYRKRIRQHAGIASVLIIPLKHHDKVYGAVELAGFNMFQPFEIGFVRVLGNHWLNYFIGDFNTLTKRLLEETRQQAERLKMQEEELLRTNEELSNQSRLLQASEEELEAR
ncbi:MAG: GAF domain-containing protein [Saprospiraceae bacterium]|nr:GAF domain-containing protein [Candidatus Brachybacter algidus]